VQLAELAIPMLWCYNAAQVYVAETGLAYISHIQQTRPCMHIANYKHIAPP